MNAVAALPTRRDEDWRYADADWLGAADPVALAEWREVAVPAGEALRETSHIVEGGVTRLRIRVGEGARYEHFAINSAGRYARLELDVTLEEAAHFEFGGVTIGGGKAVREFVTRVHHAAGSTSNQIVRSVHWGRATGNFLGRIEIPQGSQQADAAQNFKAILLEKGASANAKPELEILADDVKAAHGAAIGALDEKAGFYMAARGIPPEVVRKLLVRAFIADAFEAVADEAQHDALLEAALAALSEEAI
ncbi:MAG TPA: SufD family Fe-S cluster assembly protein [Sphingomonadaceae bacterium]|nr:SufD family Fe-S cluster assembly protein [Sphingomonadaceae bacterium]